MTHEPEDGVEIACDSKVNFSIGEPSEQAAPPIDPTKPNGQETPADEEVKMEQ